LYQTFKNPSFVCSVDLDVRMKAVLLGATFLIDFNFFEKAGNKENDQIGMMD